MKERATEHEFLLWFFQNADFGPASGDVRVYMQQSFEEETGKIPPKGYDVNEDEDEDEDEVQT